MAQTCASCGTNNPDSAKFCTSCGSSLNSAAKQEHQPFAQNSNMAKSRSNCVWCNEDRGFKEEEGKLDSKWGMTAHKVKMFICKGCGYVHLFGLGRSIWDFD